MKKLWVRWIVLVVFVALLGAVFVRLGEWQLHRLEARRERNAIVVANQALPVQPWDQVFHHPIAEGDQWQRVTVTGTYLPEHQLEVRYRNVGGSQGSEWVLPLRTSDGRLVLVDRGFTSRGNGEVARPAAAPAGQVTVTGFVRRNEQGKANATTPMQGSVRLINAPAISAAIGQQLVDGYIQAISSTPADPGLTPVGTPELDEGPHLSYAIQWFLFTVIAAGGVLILVRADLRERRRKRARAAQLNAARQA
ncbi:SURF1 family protein [Propionibacteriaceae bacterium G1746]|uniref:SURF1 family cytochrome oxidase biogenesis protein n=1 Tax=Aestuariimicrobium sp. G57 TaxID=3418485 RepID=UPI003C1D8167